MVAKYKLKMAETR